MLDPEELATRRRTAFKGARIVADGGPVYVGARVADSATTPSPARPGVEAQLTALGARIAALTTAAKRARGE
jgi:hypothetical protein